MTKQTKTAKKQTKTASKQKKPTSNNKKNVSNEITQITVQEPVLKFEHCDSESESGLIFINKKSFLRFRFMNQYESWDFTEYINLPKRIDMKFLKKVSEIIRSKGEKPVWNRRSFLKNIIHPNLEHIKQVFGIESELVMNRFKYLLPFILEHPDLTDEEKKEWRGSSTKPLHLGNLLKTKIDYEDLRREIKKKPLRIMIIILNLFPNLIFLLKNL